MNAKYCSFLLNTMMKSLNKSTIDQQTLQSLWGCLGDNHWAQSGLRSLSMDRQIKTYQIFHIWDSRPGPKASFMKGVKRGILNIANYSIVRFLQYKKTYIDICKRLTTANTNFRTSVWPCGIKLSCSLCCAPEWDEAVEGPNQNARDRQRLDAP